MDHTDYQRTHFDPWMLFSVILLVGIGITMNYSASAVLAGERYGDSYYFLKRTMIYALIGFVGMAVMVRVSYESLKKFVYPVLACSLVLVGFVFIPGIGHTIGGATRWLRIGPLTIQPSEAAKIAMIIFLAYSLEKKTNRLKSFTVGFLPHVLFMAVVSGCVLYQRDLGAAVTIAAVTWFMMYVSGVRLKYLLGMFVAAAPLMIVLIAGSDYRRKRILAFMNPWSDRFGSGFQVIQSFVSFNEGGWFGRGLGQGQQKLFYLPEAHTDFIFSVIGEELGLVGVIAVVSLYCLICYRGLKVAVEAPDLFGKYVAVGCTILLGLEAIMNMCVVMGLLPTKGLTLPFVSYGGSSLVMSLVAVGMLLNISTYKRVDRSWM